MEIRVRRAQKQDIATILSFWKELMECNRALDRWAVLKPNGVEIYEKFLKRQIRSKRAAVFVAERDGKLLGHLMVSIEKHPPVYKVDKGGFVNEIFVRRKDRGKGIGTSLLKAAEAWCRKRRLKEMNLTVNVKNAHGRRVYTAFGLHQSRFLMKKILSRKELTA